MALPTFKNYNKRIREDIIGTVTESTNKISLVKEFEDRHRKYFNCTSVKYPETYGLFINVNSMVYINEIIFFIGRLKNVINFYTTLQNLKNNYKDMVIVKKERIEWNIILDFVGGEIELHIGGDLYDKGIRNIEDIIIQAKAKLTEVNKQSTLLNQQIIPEHYQDFTSEHITDSIPNILNEDIWIPIIEKKKNISIIIEKFKKGIANILNKEYKKETTLWFLLNEANNMNRKNQILLMINLLNTIYGEEEK